MIPKRWRRYECAHDLPPGMSTRKPEREVADTEPGRSAHLGRAGQRIAWRLAGEARRAGGGTPLIVGERVEGGLGDGPQHQTARTPRQC